MIITYYGKQHFKLQQGETVVAINPISKDSSLDIKPTKFGSELVLCTARHPHYNGFDNAEYNGKEPFKIYGPGSYEINGNSYIGFKSESLIDGDSYINAVYFFTLEDISFCFLGDLAHPNIEQQIKEYTDEVDVIFVPIGGSGTLDPVQAAKLVKVFAPKVIIPMDYGNDRDAGSLETFLKEVSSDTTPESKYVFKRSDLNSLSGHVVVLDQQ